MSGGVWDRRTPTMRTEGIKCLGSFMARHRSCGGGKGARSGSQKHRRRLGRSPVETLDITVGCKTCAVARTRGRSVFVFDSTSPCSLASRPLRPHQPIRPHRRSKWVKSIDNGQRRPREEEWIIARFGAPTTWPTILDLRGLPGMTRPCRLHIHAAVWVDDRDHNDIRSVAWRLAPRETGETQPPSISLDAASLLCRPSEPARPQIGSMRVPRRTPPTPTSPPTSASDSWARLHRRRERRLVRPRCCEGKPNNHSVITRSHPSQIHSLAICAA